MTETPHQGTASPSDSSSNVRRLLDPQDWVVLERGEVLDLNAHPQCVFMLKDGEVGVRGHITSGAGLEKKTVSILDRPGMIFGDEEAYSGDGTGPNMFEFYATKSGTKIRVIPGDRLLHMLTQEPKEGQQPLYLLLLKDKARANAQLRRFALSCYQREAEARHLADQSQQMAAQNAEDARAELKEVHDKVVASKDAEIERLTRELEKERLNHAKSVADYNKVCDDFKELSGTFHAWVQKQIQDSADFIDLLNLFQVAQGLNPLTHEEVFGVMSGRGLKPQEGFTPDEGPTDKMTAPPARPTLPSVQPVAISVQEISSPADAVTRREGAGTSAPAAPMATSPEEVFVVSDEDLIPVQDEEPAPATLIAGRGIEQEPDEQELDDDGFPLRRTLVGIAPPSMSEDMLPPEMRGQANPNHPITVPPPETKKHLPRLSRHLRKHP